MVVVGMTTTVVCFAVHKTSFSYKIHMWGKAINSIVYSIIQKFIQACFRIMRLG